MREVFVRKRLRPCVEGLVAKRGRADNLILLRIVLYFTRGLKAEGSKSKARHYFVRNIAL